MARLVSNGAIAGSTLRYFTGLKNLHETTGLKLKDIIRTTSLNQAQSLGLQNLGKIERGYIADITLLDKNFVPKHVFVSGKMVK
jgi:N-acetylglucosamine-6-phosphate deacetylase